MSLPSLSSVLRGIGVGLPGSPPGTAKSGSSGGGSSGRRPKPAEVLANSAAPSSASSAKDQLPTPAAEQQPSKQKEQRDNGKQRQLLTPVPGSRAATPTPSTGGYRRRRHELEMMSDDISSPGSAFSGSGCPSEGSCSTATYAGGSGPGSGPDHSGGGWGSSSWDGSDHAWDAGESDRQRRAMGQLTVTPWGGGSGGGGGGSSGAYGTSKRAKLETSRSLSAMSSSQPESSAGDAADAGAGGDGGGGAHGRGAAHLRGKPGSAGSVLEQGYRQHSQSHSTDEWRAMAKAARVLGVDSLEERDVEDQRRASMVKAARMLGVENVEELHQNAARNRQKWAPPRSSASKAARMLGVEDVSELHRDASTDRDRGGSSRKQLGANKARQGSISCLIRALEITDTEAKSVGSVTEEDLLLRQGGARREHQVETSSPHSALSSTRATESCSSNRSRLEISDDQLAGLQTPQNSASTGEGGPHVRGFSRHSRDEMEIETPPSQPRSAALTSLRQAPAPLVAPYTNSISCPPYRLSPSPLRPPGPSPAGSPCPRQQQTPTMVMRHASDFALSGGSGGSGGGGSCGSGGSGGGEWDR
ncbi:unnamed protein product [Laminaria digitata]